ncbi:SH3 domain-containing protein [bacterium]|nr:SH3 domain-containing protein [bacterium]
MKKLLAILVTVIGVNAMAQENPSHLNVLAVNGLNMRSQPESKSRVVTKVPYGKQVEIIEKTDNELELGWVKDHWYKVRFRGREGYIFGG